MRHIFLLFTDPLQHYSDEIRVREISKVTIGQVEVRRCGNEGSPSRRLRQREITHEEYYAIETTRRILRAARSFIPDAQEDGADMKNAAFILSIPGRDFIIKAGDGDWEYVFEEGQDGEIYGRCVRETLTRYIYNRATNTIGRFCSFVARHLPLIGSQGFLSLTG